MTRRSTSRSARAWALALLLGALATWLLHRHQFASGFDLFPGPRGDTRLIAYLCEHWYQVLHGKAQLLSPSMFYPVEGTLGYSDTLLLFALPYSGLRAAGLDVFDAASVGAWLHGTAGTIASSGGPISASGIVHAVPAALRAALF